jgi:Protein of unknown function (DUF3046)
VKLTVFWDRMHRQFGPLADSFAEDHVLLELGQRTVNQALSAGVAAKDVWRAVCVEMEVPTRLH